MGHGRDPLVDERRLDDDLALVERQRCLSAAAGVGGDHVGARVGEQQRLAVAGASSGRDDGRQRLVVDLDQRHGVGGRRLGVSATMATIGSPTKRTMPSASSGRTISAGAVGTIGFKGATSRSAAVTTSTTPGRRGRRRRRRGRVGVGHRAGDVQDVEGPGEVDVGDEPGVADEEVVVLGAEDRGPDERQDLSSGWRSRYPDMNEHLESMRRPRSLASVERALGELAAEALSLVGRVDDRVDEGDRAVAQLVLGEAGQLVAEDQLVARARLRRCGRWARSRDHLGLVGVEHGEDRLGQRSGGVGVDLDGQALAAGSPHVEAQRVLEERVLRVVEGDHGPVDGEPVVAAPQAAARQWWWSGRGRCTSWSGALPPRGAR